MLHEEKLDEICARLGITPRTFLCTPEKKTVTAKECKKTIVFAPIEVNCGSPTIRRTIWNKTKFYTLVAYLQREYAGEIDSATSVFGNGDWCNPNRPVHSRVNGLHRVYQDKAKGECRYIKLIVYGMLWVKLGLLCPLLSENISSDWYIHTHCAIIFNTCPTAREQVPEDMCLSFSKIIKQLKPQTVSSTSSTMKSRNTALIAMQSTNVHGPHSRQIAALPTDTQCTGMHEAIKGKGKVKFTLEHVTKAQRGSRGIALLFL